MLLTSSDHPTYKMETGFPLCVLLSPVPRTIGTHTGTAFYHSGLPRSVSGNIWKYHPTQTLKLVLYEFASREVEHPHTERRNVSL